MKTGVNNCDRRDTLVKRRPFGPVLLTLLLATATVQSGVDPGIPDTLSIDSVVSYTNGVGIVPVYFTNDQTLAGIEVTVMYDSPDVQIDSFSFLGGRAEEITVKGMLVRGDTAAIYCFPLSLAPMPIGSGLLGTLHFSYNLSISPQVVTIDTITMLIDDIQYATRFSDPTANDFTPQITPGYLDIQQAFGCCVEYRGNVDGMNGELPNVADLTFLIDFLFKGGPPADCPTEADLDALDGPEPNVADVTYLVNFLFKGGPQPADCQ